MKFEALIKGYAGPAVMEVFGEKPFEPEMKETALRLSEEQQGVKAKIYKVIIRRYLTNIFQVVNGVLPLMPTHYQVSVNNLKLFFDETIEVNTLDEAMYMEIQQTIIEALDMGESVRVTGRNDNRTQLVIQTECVRRCDKANELQ